MTKPSEHARRSFAFPNYERHGVRVSYEGKTHRHAYVDVKSGGLQKHEAAFAMLNQLLGGWPISCQGLTSKAFCGLASLVNWGPDKRNQQCGRFDRGMASSAFGAGRKPHHSSRRVAYLVSNYGYRMGPKNPRSSQHLCTVACARA